jgi:hypothetical protein
MSSAVNAGEQHYRVTRANRPAEMADQLPKTDSSRGWIVYQNVEE